jgi:hypothetical protein
MPHSRRRFHRPLLLTAATVLLALLALPGAALAGGPHRIGLAAARSADAPRPCQALLRRDVRGKTLAARGPRLAKRLRACRGQQAPQPKATTSAAPSGPMYWGAWIGDQLTGEGAPWDMGAVSKFEAMAGKSVSLLNFSSPFADCSKSPCSFYRFPRQEMEAIRDHGTIPFFSWASQSTPSSLDEPDFQLGDVIAGNFDSYIREWAEGAKDWGHPFFLRFNWEMNGNWFPWSEGVNGNQPGEFVAAWRHVHDIFTQVGATNVTWVWCPNVDPGHQMQDLGSLYPGDEYVDWTGLDGYNWGDNPAGPRGWMSFNELFRQTYDEITAKVAPGKPLVIAETGSSEYGGSKAAWIEDALHSATSEYPDLRGLLWFENYADGMDWPLETSQSATGAFAAGLRDAAVEGADFGEIGSGPIQPPS